MAWALVYNRGTSTVHDDAGAVACAPGEFAAVDTGDMAVDAARAGGDLLEVPIGFDPDTAEDVDAGAIAAARIVLERNAAEAEAAGA